MSDTPAVPPAPSTNAPAPVPADGLDDLRARLAARKKGERKAAPGADAAAPAAPGGWLREIRGWTDTLFFAFILALFIRTYVFELFMIPTGSMTPTLIGDDARLINEVDWDGDGTQDIVVAMPVPGMPLQVHLRDLGGTYFTQLFLERAPAATRDRFADPNALGKGRRDMIMVNKFAYWFSPPERGDIAIFKTPHRPELSSMYAFDPTRPVYIKRCVGLPGETITFQPPVGYQTNAVPGAGRLTPAALGGTEFILASQPILVDGKPLNTGVFARLHHFPRPEPPGHPPNPDGDPQIIKVGDRAVLMVGDNQMSSSDGRYWGDVPLSHLRGKAILRYLPLRGFGLLSNQS